MTSRDEILSRIGSALGRTAGDPVPDAPPVLLRYAASSRQERIALFSEALVALAGRVSVAATPAEARAYVESVLGGRRAIASSAPVLKASGILSLPGVSSEFSRERCAEAEVGISSADFALADTGSLVLMSASGESRMISLLPPCHISVIEANKILATLDELLELEPQPAIESSAMVLITGPSRTADIEMRLVRGVHGPGEIHVVIVADVTA